MGDAMDQALCLEAKNGFAQWRPADAQPSRKVDFVDGLPGRDASLYDRLHDLVEDAIGERYARDGLDGGGLSTVYSHGGMKASAPREGKKSQRHLTGLRPDPFFPWRAEPGRANQ